METKLDLEKVFRRLLERRAYIRKYLERLTSGIGYSIDIDAKVKISLFSAGDKGTLWLMGATQDISIEKVYELIKLFDELPHSPLTSWEEMLIINLGPDILKGKA